MYAYLGHGKLFLPLAQNFITVNLNDFTVKVKFSISVILAVESDKCCNILHVVSYGTKIKAKILSLLILQE